MGMPKAGTSSISAFFKCAGLTTSHYECGVHTKADWSQYCGVCVHKNREAGRPPLEGCGSYQVFAQLDYMDEQTTAKVRRRRLIDARLTPC